LGAVVCASACTDKQADSLLRQQRAQLHGRWVISEGWRDNQPTETLDGLYFLFDSTGTMQTNMPLGEETPVPFSIKADQLTQQYGPRREVIYQVVEQTDSTLSMTTRSQNIQLTMKLVRE
jgi:hypothetical protein